MAPNATPPKKRRLGNLFSSKADEEQQPNKTVAAQAPQRPAPASDSGYGGSTHTTSSNSSDVKPIENHGQVAGVDGQRNLAINERTGEVLDNDTGEVVSTVTTTTTTTTTTTRRSKSPQPASANGVAGAGAPGQSSQQSQQLLSPESAAQLSSLQPPAPQAPPQQQNFAVPDLPPRSKSREPQNNSNFGNVPTMQHPAYRDHPPALVPGGGGGVGGGAAPASPLENLKGAAAGLATVGATLKDTYSNERERRYPTRNTTRVTGADLKNQAAPQAPPGEMARLHAARSSNNMRQKTPERQWQQPPPLEVGRSNWQAPWQESQQQPPGEPMDTYQNEGVRKRKSLSSMPATFTPESSGLTEEGQGFLKRMRNKKSPAPR